MRYCPYCGASLLDDAAFCISCGKSIPAVSEKATPTVLENYDGYYDDIPTDDHQTNATKEYIDPGTVKNIVLICTGAALIIGICILSMVVL